MAKKNEKNEEYVDFVVTARKYKTLLTKKYENRSKWHKPVPGEVLSNLPGTVMEIKVKEGVKVKAGQLLLIHEAMKMLNRIVAPIDGTVTAIHVNKGEQIKKNHLMLTIKPK
jgi:biotin carboxyl carrier protein